MARSKTILELSGSHHSAVWLWLQKFLQRGISRYEHHRIAAKWLNKNKPSFSPEPHGAKDSTVFTRDWLSNSLDILERLFGVFSEGKRRTVSVVLFASVVLFGTNCVHTSLGFYASTEIVAARIRVPISPCSPNKRKRERERDVLATCPQAR